MGDYDGILWNGLRITVDVRPMDGDVTNLGRADTDAIQQAIMDALPPGEVAVTITVRRLVG